MNEKAFKPGVAWLLIGSGVVLNVVLWILVFTVFNRSNTNAVLHYSVDVGIDLVGEGSRIMILPLIGLLIVSFNGSLGLMLYGTEKKISWVLWSIIPLIQLVLLGSFLLLWRLNTASDVLNYST